MDYEPGESTTGLFGGNSNWRGPVWFPVNYLLIESLQKYHHYYGNDSRVECATGSGLFLPDGAGRRPVHGGNRLYAEDPHWKDLVLFYEYFHGEEGHGVGASHQTGWTGLTGKLLQQNGE